MESNKEKKKVECEKASMPQHLNEKKWFFIDLKGKTIGRLSPLIANLLRGRYKENFAYNFDLGNNVVLINASYIKFSSKKKLTDKFYFDHSQYRGGLRKRSTKKMINKYPEELIFRIVRGMLPKNKLSKKQLKRLFIFKEDKHNLIAQQKNFNYINI